MLSPAVSRPEFDEPAEQAALVLLIAGHPDSSVLWTRLRPVLRSYGLRIVSVRPPHGHRAAAGQSQFQHAAALKRLLADQRSPAVVVGHGRGAGTALALAVIAPHHVGSLVLVAYRRNRLDARRLDQHLPGIRCPIIVVAGARHRLLHRRTIAAVARKLPEFDVITTDTRHLIPVDDPGVVATAILRALSAQFRNSLRRVRPPLDR